MKWRLLVPWVAALGYLILAQTATSHIESVLWWEVAAFIWCIFWMVASTRKTAKIDGGWMINLSFVFFVFCALAVLLFLDRQFFRSVLNFISTMVIFWFLISAATLVDNKASEQKKVAGTINILTLFFLNSILFGWLTFLTRQSWTITLISLVAYWFFFFLFFLFRGLSSRIAILPSFVLTLIFGELFWVINQLSLGFLIKGLLLSSVAVYLSNITIWPLQQKWSGKKFTIYTVILILLIILILLSARWV